MRISLSKEQLCDSSGALDYYKVKSPNRTRLRRYEFQISFDQLREAVTEYIWDHQLVSRPTTLSPEVAIHISTWGGPSCIFVDGLDFSREAFAHRRARGPLTPKVDPALTAGDPVKENPTLFEHLLGED